MTTYNGFGVADPGLSFGADPGSVNLGTAFRPTAAGCLATGVRVFAPSGGSGALTGWVGAIFASSGTGGATGSALVQGNFTTIVRGAWNQVTFSTAYALTQNLIYYVVAWMPGNNYGYISHEFTGLSYTNGPLTITASTTSELSGVYAYGAAIGPPASNFNDAWYGVDVEISDGLSGVPAQRVDFAAGRSSGPSMGSVPSSLVPRFDPGRPAVASMLPALP
jgi:hypothetical protein